jgi:hypothetical protein
MSVGGGVDVSVNDRFKVRLFQLDYSPIFLGDRGLSVLGQTGVIQNVQLDGQRQDNVRISFGVIF